MLVCVKVGSCYIKGHVEDGFQMKDDKLCKSLPKGTFLRCRDFPIHSSVASMYETLLCVKIRLGSFTYNMQLCVGEQLPARRSSTLPLEDT